ncbi:MAG: S8/S53 family peptidase [Bacteroidota bacterium]
MPNNDDNKYIHYYNGERIEFEIEEDTYHSFFFDESPDQEIQFNKDIGEITNVSMREFKGLRTKQIVFDRPIGKEAARNLKNVPNYRSQETNYRHLPTLTTHIGSSSLIILANRELTIEEVQSETNATNVVKCNHFFRVGYANENETRKAIKKLQRRKLEGEGLEWLEVIEMNLVNYIHPEVKGNPITNDIPPDTELAPQHAYDITNTFRAHERFTFDQTVKVAIFDVGVDPYHKDLKRYIDEENSYDYVNRTSNRPTQGNSRPQKNEAHGTCCAGLAAALKPEGTIGINGVGKGNQISSYRIGFGNFKIDLFYIIAAFYQAIDNGIRVISCSWNIGPPYETLKRAIEDAVENGIVVIFSAGNMGRKIGFPASLSSVITVSALDENYEPKKWNSTPPNYQYDWASNFGNGVDIAAPGLGLITTDNTGKFGDNTSSYAVFNGTSSACPLVSGCVALMLIKNPDLTPMEIKHLLVKTSKDFLSNNEQHYGYGILDVESAVEAAIEKTS